jgi:hypothetical protein
MLSDAEWNEKIETVCGEFVGQIDDLYAVVGMMQVGRLYGWRVMRLASRRGHWSLAIKLFGDPKTLLPERGKLAHKSIGLAFVDKSHDYWEVIKGHISIDKDLKRNLC